MQPHVSIIKTTEDSGAIKTSLRIGHPNVKSLDIELSLYQKQLLICDLASSIKIDMEHKDFEYHNGE